MCAVCVIEKAAVSTVPYSVTYSRESAFRGIKRAPENGRGKMAEKQKGLLFHII
jgi:hypothetical protein